MLRHRALRIGRVGGIPIEIHPTWFVAFALLTGVLAVALLPEVLPGSSLAVRVLLASITTLLVYACLIAHELSHSLVARRFGVDVDRVTLFMFGGVSQLLDEPHTPRHEWIMAVAGPGMSVALGIMWWLVSLVVPAFATSGLSWLVLYLARVNVLIAAFNLLPGYPMDGGRVLHAYMWWASGNRLAATRVASWVGSALGAAVAGAGLWMAISGELAGGWLVIVGAFILNLARAAYRRQEPRLRASRVEAGALAMRPLPAIDASADAAVAAGRASAAGLPAIGVVSDGRFVGLLPTWPAEVIPSGADAGRLAIRDRAWLVDASESASTALRRFQLGAPALVVVERDRAVGLLTPSSIARAADRKNGASLAPTL